MGSIKSALAQVRVRYSETDRMGYVYHANHAQYFEVARVEMLRELGVNYQQLEDSGVLLPVVDLHIKYHSPAHYDELLTIETKITRFSAARLVFSYRMENETKVLLAEGETTLVFVDASTRKPRRAPDNIVQLLDGLET